MLINLYKYLDTKINLKFMNILQIYSIILYKLLTFTKKI